MARFVPGGHILFVCNGGIVLSPMAAAVFKRKMVALKFDCCVGSAGLMPFMAGCSAVRQWSMIEGGRNYDLSEHHCSFLGDPGVYSPATFIAGMNSQIIGMVRGYSRVNVERLSILNPPNGVLDPVASMTLDAYETSFAQICAGVDKLIETLGIGQP